MNKSPSAATFMHLHHWKYIHHKSIHFYVNRLVWEKVRPMLKFVLVYVPNLRIHQLIESIQSKKYKGTTQECNQAIYDYLMSTYDECPNDYDFLAEVDIIFLYLPKLFVK